MPAGDTIVKFTGPEMKPLGGNGASIDPTAAEVLWQDTHPPMKSLEKSTTDAVSTSIQSPGLITQK